MFDKVIFNNLYSDLNANNLITKNQSGFRPGDSTTNQLLFLADEIHQAFEDHKCVQFFLIFPATEVLFFLQNKKSVQIIPS